MPTLFFGTKPCLTPVNGVGLLSRMDRRSFIGSCGAGAACMTTGWPAIAADAKAHEYQRVLLVDETCESGNTIKLALAAVREQKPAAVKTAVSFKTGAYKPDFHALENENFIILPWDLEVIVNGEIVVRPDYREKLKEGPPR